MSEIGTRRVIVEARANGGNVVVADFGGKQSMSLNRDCHVYIELTEAELRLTGKRFIEAARAALKRTIFGDNTVMLYTNNKIRLNVPDTQMLGRRMSPDDIALTDNWKYANFPDQNS